MNTSLIFMQRCYCLLHLTEVETNLYFHIPVYWFRENVINFILTKASERSLRDEIDALEGKNTVLEKSLTVNVISFIYYFIDCFKLSFVKFSCHILFDIFISLLGCFGT